MKFKNYIVLIAVLTAVLSLVLFLKDISLKKQQKFNVILIVVDALRADHLGCYGYARDTSPNIDKFSKEGVLFSNAFSQGSATCISVPSIFTSLYPRVHNVFEVGGLLREEFTTLPEILQKKGYITMAFVGPQLGTIANFINRFKFYDIKSLKNYNQNTTEKVLNWLKQNYSQPFFLYLHHLNTSLIGRSYKHTPFPYNNIFWQKDINNKIRDFLINSSVTKATCRSFFSSLTPQEEKIFLDYVISQYDGKIRYADDQIKAILEELERLGLFKNTIVILTSDHGEEFLEHGQFLHGTDSNVYDELIHIPLIMRLPKIFPHGKIVSNLVRHIDIMPTVLNILGISSPRSIQGVNLTPLLQGKKDLKLETFNEIRSGRKYLKGIRMEKWKIIQSYDSQENVYSYELYDLEKDPKELNNLAEKLTKEVEQLKAKLKDYTSSCEKIRRSILGENFIDKPITLDEDTKGVLRQLGYLQ